MSTRPNCILIGFSERPPEAVFLICAVHLEKALSGRDKQNGQLRALPDFEQFALIDRYVLHSDLLLATSAVALERLHLHGEGASPVC